MMEITFLGAVKTVTGSRYLLSVGNKKILVDCGLFQGYKELRLRNWEALPFDPQSIDAVLITHAHIDHTGYIPLLVKNGYKGKIYCTHGTLALCSILLPDSGHLQEEDARLANRYHYSKHHPALPLYTADESKVALEHFRAVEFNKSFQLFDQLSIQFLPAGHIIGASIIHLVYQGTSITFTGDLGRPQDPIMQPPAMIPTTDYLVTESTYGDRLHGKADPLDQIEAVVNEAVANFGCIVIPAFAVGRTQDILYYLYLLKNANRIPDLPVYLDSPMAQDASDLLIHYSHEHRLSKDMCKNICKIAKYTRTPAESKLINESPSPKIIISASGMAEGGRILHHLKNYLPDKRNTILFTGYQSPGTRGDRLIRGETEVKIHGEFIPVNAKVAVMSNMSAHADYQEMLDWYSHIKKTPRKVFLTHGDIESAASLKEKIEEKFGWDCVVPEYMQTERLV